MSFENLGLIPEILEAVTEKGYTEPTPIQAKAIPPILNGEDIMGAAQTGTGKTASFTLPLLQILSMKTQGKKRVPLGLVLVPTRELAAQVNDSLRAYGKKLPLKSTVIFGGVNMKKQVEALRRGVDIIVATPGRLLDHLKQKNVDLSTVKMVVLDEADRILDMGFVHDVRRILSKLPYSRQTLMFSATFSKEIKALAQDFLNDPTSIKVASSNTTAEKIEQRVHFVDRERKTELLYELIIDNKWDKALVFTRTKHSANKLSERLEKDGIPSAAIHGNKSQGARTKALNDFKKDKVRILVATDIAARGLDVPKLPHVINFELPTVPEDYVHRIGRTARAGEEGEAISLVCIDEHKLLRDIERFTKQDLDKSVIEGFEPDKSIKAQPIRQGRGGPRPQKDSSRGASRSGKGKRPSKSNDKPNRKEGARNSFNKDGKSFKKGPRSEGGKSFKKDFRKGDGKSFKKDSRNSDGRSFKKDSPRKSFDRDSRSEDRKFSKSEPTRGATRSGKGKRQGKSNDKSFKNAKKFSSREGSSNERKPIAQGRAKPAGAFGRKKPMKPAARRKAFKGKSFSAGKPARRRAR